MMRVFIKNFFCSLSGPYFFYFCQVFIDCIQSNTEQAAAEEKRKLALECSVVSNSTTRNKIWLQNLAHPFARIFGVARRGHVEAETDISAMGSASLLDTSTNYCCYLFSSYF